MAMHIHITKVRSPYLLSITLLSIIYCLNHSHLASVYTGFAGFLNSLEFVVYFILIYKIAASGYSLKQLIIYFVLGTFFLVGYFHTGYAAMLRTFLVLVAAKNEDYSKVLKVLVQGLVFGMLLVLALYLIGVSDAGVQRRGALSFGFVSPNVPAGLIQTVIFAWVSFINRKLKLTESLICLGVAFLIYMLLGTRTTCILVAALPFAIYIGYAFKGKNLMIYRLLQFTPFILAGATYVTSFLYEKNAYIQKINVLLGSRIFMNYFNLNKYGITLFGSRTSFEGDLLYNPVTEGYSTFNTLDGAYICLLIQFGVVAMMLWLLLYHYVLKLTYRNKNVNLYTVALFISIHGFVESSTIDIIISFVLIYLYANKSQYNIKNNDCSVKLRLSGLKKKYL